LFLQVPNFPSYLFTNFFFFNLALNIFFSSNAKYIGTPTAAADFRLILKSSLELKCQYNGSDGDGQFVGWYKDDEAITTDKSKHYAVKSSKKESKLTIIIGKY
jgi:hypothetical protein